MSALSRLTVVVGIIIASFCKMQAQMYFPPLADTTWQTANLTALGWCEGHLDSLYSFLSANNTRAFIVLKAGKMAIEWYPDSLTKKNFWYWASAAKSLTSVLVGIAQQEGKLDITTPTSNYLGKGWTSLSEEQEQQITVRNQLTMTSGLDDGVDDNHCTKPECLVFKASPGTRWAYHNAPYTLLDSVIQVATGMPLNKYLADKVKAATGMDGGFVRVDFDNIMYSTPRSMARFGLLALNNFVWNHTPVLTDQVYINHMLNTSQDLNKSYGYLWWLNGKESFMLPQIQLVINGPIIPHAPADAVNALGKNDQILCVVPSEQLVIVRMGDNTQGADVSIVFLDSVWQHLRSIICSPTSVANESTHDTSLVRGLGTVMPGSNVYMVDLTGQAMLVCSGSQMFNPALLTNRSVLCTTTVLDAVGNPTVYVLVGN